jgi:hypothetical protein
MSNDENPQNSQRDPPSGGRISSLINAVKGLTITNVIVIILLAFVLGPAYIIYRALNDEALLDRFLSHYTEVPSQDTNCLIREIRMRGGPDAFGIATGFAYYGSDRWQIGVVINQRPDNEDIQTYCATLNLLVDFMRDPDARSPNFPNSNVPVVQPYPQFPPEAFGGPR